MMYLTALTLLVTLCFITCKSKHKLDLWNNIVETISTVLQLVAIFISLQMV